MAVILTDFDRQERLDEIDFIEQGKASYFKISNVKGSEVVMNYVPYIRDKWDPSRFEVYLFENPYLDAENDVFELYESTLDERLGWIFPLSLLESNDNDYSDHKNLNNYKFITIYKLLSKERQISRSDVANGEIRISDLYGTCCICVISTDTRRKISNFNFNNYLLSFYNYGYIVYKDHSLAKGIYDRSEFVKLMRNGERTRINLIKSNFDICENTYTKALFVDHLMQSDNFIIRFIFLYQILELFMQFEFDRKFQENLALYTDNKLSKNDFKEAINQDSRERELIKKVILVEKIDSGLAREFDQKCEMLFKELSLEIRNSFSDKIYDLRNLITHRLRDITLKQEKLKPVIDVFERVSIDFLIGHDLKKLI